MSFCTRATCPHDRGVFIWHGDGPWLGNESDPDYGGYPWVHDTAVGPGHLQVCDRMPFATAEEAGEVCACEHPTSEHQAGPGPIPSGMSAKPRPCACGCPDFRHRAEDLARYWERERGRRPDVSAADPVAPRAPVAAPALAGAVQLDLFGGDAS